MTERSLVSCARGGTEGGKEPPACYLEGKEMFYMLIVMLVTRMYTFLKTQQITHLNYVYFIVCILCLNKVVCKMWYYNRVNR